MVNLPWPAPVAGQGCLERRLTVKILFIGDIVGRPGRHVLQEALPQVREQYRPDFIIANCENAASGWGITTRTAQDLLDAGIDCLTSGNHIWANKEGPSVLNNYPEVLRPANFTPGVPGRGSGVFTAANGVRVGVINLIGRIFMDPADCPFRAADAELEELGDEPAVVFVDFHAEATSEKQAMGYYLDGRVTAAVGTHTHVPTADETILPEGTAYLTDAGMTGPVGTVIGVDREIVLRRFVQGMPERFEVPKGGPGQLSGVLVTACLDRRGAKDIQRVSMSVA